MFSWFKPLLAAVAIACSAQAEARVDYSVEFTAPEHHLAEVGILFPQSTGPYLDVKMPSWRTGRYMLLPLANGVRRFTATDSAGRPLRISLCFAAYTCVSRVCGRGCERRSAFKSLWTACPTRMRSLISSATSLCTSSNGFATSDPRSTPRGQRERI